MSIVFLNIFSLCIKYAICTINGAYLCAKCRIFWWSKSVYQVLIKAVKFKIKQYSNQIICINIQMPKILFTFIYCTAVRKQKRIMKRMSMSAKKNAPALKKRGYHTMLNTIITVKKKLPLYLFTSFPSARLPRTAPKQNPSTRYEKSQMRKNTHVGGSACFIPIMCRTGSGLPERKRESSPASETHTIPAITGIPSIRWHLKPADGKTNLFFFNTNHLTTKI